MRMNFSLGEVYYLLQVLYRERDRCQPPRFMLDNLVKSFEDTFRFMREKNENNQENFKREYLCVWEGAQPQVKVED